ncbi:WD-repeat protein (plasmid) [Nostoc sp. NIES-2111]|nr:WD-repeat protein [Nostoc sp. NIES-2111]
MNKLVVLKLDGSFHEGFGVNLEIGEDGSLPDIELSDNALKLPPLPTLPDTYQNWCNSYRSLDGYRIKPKKDQITNVRFQSLKEKCHEQADILKQKFITWLQADSFRRIKEVCLRQLNATDKVRVIIRTNETQLRKLPWHLWDLFEYYPHAEVAFSSLSAQRLRKSTRPNIRILIILGNSEGINVAEDEKLLKQYCQAAQIIVLAEPTPAQLNQNLWDDTGWDMIFFSGHSRTESTKGRIFLNRTDSLTMEELRYGLQTAVSKGLQLAFFNSCDGLGMAAELENLHIPQVIVMREPVPDKVAHEFLKNFIHEFTGRQSLYQSVNIARKKLQGLETEYPCASWLPIIIQNLLATPPTWQSLGAVVNCPYRGLAAFQEQDAPYFHGRETVTQQLVAAVKRKHLVAVVGASGSGKSSVVFAGLIGQLKQDKSQHWQIVSFRPGNNPLESLAMAMPAPGIALSGGLRTGQGRLGERKNLSGLVNHQSANPHLRLAELELEVELKSSDNALQTFLESIITASPKSHIVLIADQFEELYTLCQDTKERKIFLDHLLNAVNTVPGFTLVLTLRADFFGEALSYRPFADALQDAQLNLGPMNALELETAIEKPAHSLNVQLEPGLTQRLIDVVLDSPSHLPLLEFTLTQLWQKQQQGWLTHQAYADIGGVETALANHAESVYAQLSIVDKERVRQIFIQLVQPTDNSADIRRLATREEVGEENWQLVAQLADARLVVTNRHEITNVETVEIIHEALIKNWRRLQQWMQVDREFRCWQEQLRAVIRQWENSDKDAGTLLRGKALIDAEERLMQRSQEIPPHEQSFINLSLELREREQNEKNAVKRRIIIGLATGFAGALLLSIFALWQWQQSDKLRQEIQISELKSQSLLNANKNQIKTLTYTIDVLKRLEKFKQLETQTKISLLVPVVENLNQIREYNRLEGHEGEVSSVSYAPHGQLLVSASGDKTIKVWGHNGQLIQTLSGHQDSVFSVMVSQDSQLLIAGSFDNTVTIWRYNAATGLFDTHPFLTITEKDGLSAISLTSDSRMLVTANQKGQVKFWTLEGKLIQTTPAHSQKIWSLSFSPDGRHFAIASADKTVKIWTLAGKLLTTLVGHSEEVLSVNFSPDGKTLATASKDKTVKLWDLTGKLLHTFNGHEDEVLDVRFSPDGRLIASASADDTVKIWSIDTQKQLYTLQGHGGKASEASFSLDSKTIATASANRTVKLWRLEGMLPNLSGNHISISPDGETIALSNQQGIITLRQRDGSLVRSFKAHEREITKVIFSPTDKNIVTLGKDNQIKLWDLSGKLLKSWQSNKKVSNSIFDSIKDINFSPDGKQLATIGGSDRKIQLWNLEGVLLRSWQADNILVTSISFSPDSKSLITSGDKTVKLWNLEGKLLKVIPGHQDNITSVKFSPDGKVIATGSIDKTVKLWHSQNAELLRTLQLQEIVYDIVFSPDSQVLVSASSNKINFWNLEGKLLHTLQEFNHNLSEINFGLDGNIIASVDVQNNVTLWNLSIKDLQQQSCDWLHDYFTTNPNLDAEERRLCGKKG